ncbi:amidohydrolase [Halomonas sp. HP20-15]|uniref:amidohydrolase n=1 Tax=Halomonas sp. HP20-15 TaxID=3085901 RepID=UPI002980A7DA|nr:amidohydrolase [Halomonas sp. HP20-15]MDW5377346.1 amidohydrolase [Halomonas sp. HP20-15]
MLARPSGLFPLKRLAAATLVALAGSAWTGGAWADEPPADTVLQGGAIYTVDADNATAEALAVRDGVIVYVGDAAGAEAYVGPETRVFDLDGKMVMPGLQDAHIHGITIDRPRCDLEYQPLTVEALTTRLETCLDNPDFGEGSDDWLVVDHWYVQFLTPPGTTVTKEVLDGLDTERPIIVNGVWGHSALANSRALELAGIDAETANPSDGVVKHDAAGEPNGWLLDGAQELVRQAMPAAPAVDPVEAARRGMQALIKEGVTSFQAQSENRDTVAAFAALRERHGLPARAHFLIDSGAKSGDELEAFIDELDALRAEFEHPEQLPLQVRAWRPGEQAGPRLVPEPGVSVAGVGEMMADGILQAPAQTAALLEPYRVNKGNEGDPNWVPGDSRGEAYVDAETLGIMATRFAARGYQTQIHAIGDRAVRNTLNAFEALREHDDIEAGRVGYGRAGDSRPLMSHAELVDPADHARFAQLGVVPVMSYQWAKPAPDSTDAVKPYLGTERWKGYEPEGDLAAAGAKIAYGSDYPVDPLDHWFAIEAAVLREADWGPAFPQYAGVVNPDQALSLEAAIRGITLNAAYAMHQDTITGSLETGKLADLLILDRNLFEIARDDISETQVLLTMVGGEVVYTAEGFAP